jgi:ATP-dependent protease ClpP protease subunit
MPIGITAHESHLHVEVLGEVTDSLSAPFATHLESADFNSDIEIHFHINSDSHNVVAALRFVDIIRDNNLRTTCRCNGQVGLFGLLLARACDRRSLSRTARLLVYCITLRNDVDMNEDDIVQMLQMIRMLKARARALMPVVPLLHGPVNYNWFEKYYEFTAEAAVNCGLFDEISDRLKIRVGPRSNIYG